MVKHTYCRQVSVDLEKIGNSCPNDLPADGTGVGVWMVVVPSLDVRMHDVACLPQCVTESAHVPLQPLHFVSHVDQGGKPPLMD